MISLHRIARLASQASADPSSASLLLEEILGSTRPLPLSARLRLQADDTLPVVAIGLGLSRCVDLSFVPTERTIALAERLLAHQGADGSFGSVSASAVAIAALLKASEQIERAASGLASDLASDLASEPASNRGFAERAHAGAESALAWLSERLTPAPASDWRPIDVLFEDEEAEYDAGSEQSLACEPIDAAIALWQLADRPAALNRFDAEALLETLERCGARHERAIAQLLDRASSAMRSQPAFPTHPTRTTPALIDAA